MTARTANKANGFLDITFSSESLDEITELLLLIRSIPLKPKSYAFRVPFEKKHRHGHASNFPIPEVKDKLRVRRTGAPRFRNPIFRADLIQKGAFLVQAADLQPGLALPIAHFTIDGGYRVRRPFEPCHRRIKKRAAELMLHPRSEKTQETLREKS